MRLEDEPLGYDPAIGPRVSFGLSYRQRGSVPEDPAIFGVGQNWSCSFRAYIVHFATDPSNEMKLHKGGAGWIEYVVGHPQDQDGSILSTSGGGYQVEYADGSIEDFQQGFTNSTGLKYFLLTTQKDPVGNATTRNYEAYPSPPCSHMNTTLSNSSPTAPRTHVINCYFTNCTLIRYFLEDCCITNCTLVDCAVIGSSTNCSAEGPPAIARLQSIQDGDGNITTLYYEDPVFTNQITTVVDPYNRTNFIHYDAGGYISNIVDVAGLTSFFAYDTGANRGYITNVTTPYGNTGFRYGETYGTNDYDEIITLMRFAEITPPMGGKHLELYLDQCTNLLAAAFSPVPVTLPFSNTFDNIRQNMRVTFSWEPLQYTHLSSAYTSAGNVANLTSDDFKIARLRHWLAHGDPPIPFYASQALSLERLPSPDGVTDGQMTWYDYDGKLSCPSYNECQAFEGTNLLPCLVAMVLPDGNTRFTHYIRGHHGEITQETATYTQTNGSVGLRTNIYIYSANGIDLLQQIGRSGEQVVSNYFGNAHHQPNASYDALNQETRYTYNANQQISTIQTPGGLTTVNTWSASNQLAMTVDLEIHRTNSYTYANGLILTHTDERGLTTTNYWDQLQHLTGTCYPDGSSSSNIYTHLDITAAKDRMGFWNYSVYNAIRQKTSETNANGIITSYGYCDCGALLSVINALGTSVQQTTLSGYDYQGNRTNILYGDGYSVTNWFSSLGQTYRTQDGLVSNYMAFNNQGLLISTTNALAMEQVTTFDIEDRPIWVTDANNVIVTNSYDSLGRLRTRTYPDTGVESFGYSARGLTSQTNQIGFTTFYTYDEASRKTFETNANSEVTQFHYDAAGSLTNLLDGNNQNTFWKYDEYGRVTNKVDALGTNSFLYSYDADGHLTNRTSAAKGSTVYRYDAVGNLTNIVYPISSNIVLKYDALNCLTDLLDGIGTTHYTYDATGQILSEDGPWPNDTVSYTYAKHLRASLGLLQPNGSGWNQTYGYDAAKRLTNITSIAGTFSYFYPTSSNQCLVSGIVLPPGSYITNVYDGNARLLNTRLKDSSHTILNSHEYIYNLVNQRTEQTFSAGNYVDYTYDNIGQLKTASGKEPGGTTNRLLEQLGYFYDAAGNLNRRTNNALIQEFNVNSLNQLKTNIRSGTLTVAGTTTGPATNVTVNNLAATLYLDNTFARSNFTLTSGNNTFTAVAHDSYGRQDQQAITVNLPATNIYVYDLNGNLRTNGTRTFDYDDENQLSTIVESNAWKSEFFYDGKRRRRIRREYTWTSGAWTQTNEVHYVYDGKLVIQERDGNGLPQITYTRGNDISGSLDGAGGIAGLLAFSKTMAGNLQNFYYHADGNGNITALINASQISVGRYSYDPFGNILTATSPTASANPYRFSSKEIDANSGLYYYLYRFYDPRCQRWINRDPSEEKSGPNLYRFSSCDPINLFDLFGLCDCAQLRKDVQGFEAAARDLDRMYNNWKPGQTWKDYHLAPVANAAGYRSGGFSKLSQCAQAAVNQIEHDAAITGMNVAQLGIVGGVGYYTAGLHGLVHKTSAQEQWWLTHIAIERFRTKLILGKLRELLDCCKPNENKFQRHVIP